MTHRAIAFIVIAVLALSTVPTADADIIADWIAPPDGSAFPAGTSVNVSGQASASGMVGGAGLDLALVMDSSGSMRSGGRAAAQRNACNALVDALPESSSSVAVVEFDYDANLVRQLTSLLPLTNKQAIHNAINSVDASGGTHIGSGIAKAMVELTGSRHTAGRQQMMVVLSDGSSSGNPAETADNAVAGGIDAIHSVGLPGHNVGTMRSIVDGNDDSYGTADDHGVYTDATNLNQIVSIFDGTGGNLVGLDHVDLTLPDGTFLPNYAIDGLGNFQLTGWVMQPGANVFTVTAFDSENNSFTDTLTLVGTSNTIIPEPATFGIWSLLTALGAAIGYRRRNRHGA